MIYDTAGNIIHEPTPNCDCGLTGGCEKCNPGYYVPDMSGGSDFVECDFVEPKDVEN